VTVEFFREQEKTWADRLHGLSLVSEAGFDLEDSLAAFRFVFRSYRAQHYFREDRVRLLQRYPASLLAGMTGIASSRYDEGTFWPRVGETVGQKLTQTQMTELSDGFRTGLDRFHLSRFETPLRNIGEILMHAGIPVSSTENFLRLLADRDSRRPDLTGEDFCGWVAGMPREIAATKGLDAPTWRFLKEGGEVASDLIDRFLAYLDAAAANRSGDIDAALNALPVLLAAEVQRIHDRGEITTSLSRRMNRRQARSPRVVYVYGQVQVHLPSIESAESDRQVWQFSAQGESWSRHVHLPWFGQQADPVFESLAQPVTTIVVSLPSHSLEWQIHVIDPGMPLLAFDQVTGQLIPASHQLPRSWVWLAFPNSDDKPIDVVLDADGDFQLIEHPDPPLGWYGWTFAKVDLSLVRSVGLAKGAERRRYVSTVQYPVLQTEPPVRCIRLPDGAPVYDRRPWLTIPLMMSDPSLQTNREWNLQIVDAAGEIVSVQSIAAGAKEVDIDPWEGYAAPLIGRFELRVLGALGRSARFEVAVAEDLVIETTPEFRWFDHRGILNPSTVRLRCGNSENLIRLTSDQVAAQATVGDGDQFLNVLVEPEHMWTSTETAGCRTRRSTMPASVEIEDLSRTALLLNMPARRLGRIMLVGGSDWHPLQDEVVESGASGLARLPLSRLVDTARSRGGGDIYSEVDGALSLVGRIRPRRLVESLRLLDNQFYLDLVYDNLDLQLQIQMENAPWHQVAPVHVPAGTDVVAAPDVALGRGPITVEVRMFDQWGLGTATKRSAATSENSFRLEPGIDLDRNSLEDAFVRWVAGINPLPAVPETMRFILDIYGAMRTHAVTMRSPNLLRELADYTVERGDLFLDAVRTATWSKSSHTRLLAEGWPATAPAGGQPIDLVTWQRSPYLGLLESLGGESSPAFSEVLSTWLGPEACSILEHGIDPERSIGSFGDRNIGVLADLPPEEVDRIWRAVSLVPGPLLSRDQRAINARLLFDQRENQLLARLIDVSPRFVDEVRALLGSCYEESSLEPIDARNAPKTWRQLPQTSLAISFAARLAARDVSRGHELYDYARAWFADLADCAPGFVEQDLLLAELWLTHWDAR